MTDLRAHWNERYQSDETELSWFEAEPSRSLALIREAAPNRDAAIIDVGGGASRLTDALLDEGYRDLTVLDLSHVALARTKARLGARAERVTWIEADITQWRPRQQWPRQQWPRQQWDVWHDRALFHFLTDEARQQAYLEALAEATLPGARVIIAGFSLEGPERCSGLPVTRYDAKTLAERLGGHFRLDRETLDVHVTPKGASQHFFYARFLRL